MEIKVMNIGGQCLPDCATPDSAGLDLRADIEETLTIHPMERKLVPTGLRMQMQQGEVGLVCPKSGLAIKHGISVLNAPGIIDADFRGEVKVILINLSDRDYMVEPGDRIAQLVVMPYHKVVFVESDSLDDTERGEGGFGHSGK